MHHFIANSPFSAKVYYVNQLQHSRGIPIRSYCAVVSLLTVCLEPVVFVWALLQCGAHFHTFFIEVLQSFPVSVFLIWSQVLLFLSNLLSQFFLILQWIFKKKHSCSFPFFFPCKEYWMEKPYADVLKVICVSIWEVQDFCLLLQKWNKQCSPRTLLVLFDCDCSVCRAAILVVAICSCLADKAWLWHFSVNAGLGETSEPFLSWPSFLFPAALPLLSFWLVWPLRRFFLEVSLIPATVGSSLSVDPPPPSLMCFLVLLTDFFSGLAGINRGDDGHDCTVPVLEKQNERKKKYFVGHFVFKLVH